MHVMSKREVVDWDLSSTLVQLHTEASCLCGRGCSGRIGSGHIMVLQSNSWEWPLILTRHAVLQTNTHRVTVTCVSHSCKSPRPNHNLIPTTHTYTPTHAHIHSQSCSVYLMNSTLGAGGAFAGTVWREDNSPR